MAKKIITVDDAQAMRRMISFTLREVGYEVLEACDGAEALALLQKEKVDLVITDLNMPNMDGITLTKNLRTLQHLKSTPILLLTTESSPEMKGAGKTAGATGWIVKPFQQEQLIAVVNKVIST